MLLKNQKDNKNLISQINDFKKQLEMSGQNPEQLLQSLMSSGKYSQQDLERAKNMANMFKNLIK